MFKYNLLASQRRVKLLSILSVFLFVVLFPLRGMNGLTLPFMELKLVDSYVIHAGFALSIPFVIHALRVNNIFGIYAKCVYSAIVLIWLVSIISNIYLDLPTEDVHGINVRAFQIGVAYYSLVYLVCGYSFAAYGIFGNERIYIFLFVAYTILSIAQIDSSILQVNFYSVADEYSGNYLMVADLYAIVALLVASSATNWTFRYAVIVLALFVLYILYSRTSFFVFLMVVCFAELVFNKKQALIRWFILFSLVFAVIAIGLAFGDGDGFASNRMLSVFIAEQDGSAIERVVQFDSGLSRLYDRWIVGDYAGQVMALGRVGAYMHNILSYWQQYGILVFLLIVCSIFILLFSLFDKSKTNRFYMSRYVFLVLYCVICSVLSRSYVHYLLFFSLGIGLHLTSRGLVRPPKTSPQ